MKEDLQSSCIIIIARNSPGWCYLNRTKINSIAPWYRSQMHFWDDTLAWGIAFILVNSRDGRWVCQHQQCTLNMLWQVICLRARNNPFSNARILHWTCCLDNKVIDNKAKSALFLQVQTLTTSKSPCWAWSAEAAPPVQRRWSLDVVTHPIWDWGSVCGTGTKDGTRCLGNAADVMSDSSAVTPGLSSIRAQLAQQQHIETCTLRGRSKGREEGLSSSLLGSATVHQPQLNRVQ